MSYYSMNGLGGWMPTGGDVAKATQGAVGVFAGAVVAKFVTGFLMDIGLKKTTDAAGVTTYSFKAKGGSDVTVTNAAGPLGAKDLDSGRTFGGKLLSVVPGLAPVAVGFAFYAKGQSSDGEAGRVWLTSSGLGMIGYGLGHVLKAILERVDIDYSSVDSKGAYTLKSPASTWAQKTAAVLPFGAVDTYESNIVINGLGYAGGVRGYMRRGMNGLGYNRNPGAPTFVESVRGLGRAPAEIQTLVASSGISAAPSTIEPVSMQGLAATLM